MDGDRQYILVVDDMRDAADSMAELLDLWGYDGEAWYGGEAALAAARLFRPAAVLLDLKMPRMDGFEFVARLRDIRGCEQTAVVVVSGQTSEACRARAGELGISHYLLKPADPCLVRALLARLVVPPEPPRPRAKPRLWKEAKVRPGGRCLVG